MQKTASNQILFLGGLKGFLAVLIILIHYLMAFFPCGHIGWGTGCAANDCCRVYFQNYPTALIMRFACMLVALLAGLPLILASSEIMYRLVEIPTGRFTKYLVGKLT